MQTPIFGLHFEKKKKKDEKTWEVVMQSKCKNVTPCTSNACNNLLLYVDKFSVFVYVLMRTSKTKDTMYNTHLNFLNSFSRKKVPIIYR